MRLSVFGPNSIVVIVFGTGRQTNEVMLGPAFGAQKSVRHVGNVQVKLFHVQPTADPVTLGFEENTISVICVG